MDPTRIVVLLTAGVMAIAGIFTFWGASLVKKTLDTENETSDLCVGAMFKFYSGRYDGDAKNLYLVLENQRSIDLRLEKLYVFYPNDIKTFELNESLEGNMLKSINVAGVEDGFSTGTIKTNCPDVSVDFSYSQLS